MIGMPFRLLLCPSVTFYNNVIFLIIFSISRHIPWWRHVNPRFKAAGTPAWEGVAIPSLLHETQSSVESFIVVMVRQNNPKTALGIDRRGCSAAVSLPPPPFRARLLCGRRQAATRDMKGSEEWRDWCQQ